MEDINTVLHFWFGTESDDQRVAEQQSDLWWKKNPQVDAEIRQRFSGLLDAAAGKRLDSWQEDSRGRLALIILADQFSRNMYRDTARAFEFDYLSLAWCKQGLAAGAEEGLRLIEKVFFYLPLEHSESIDDQNRSVTLYGELARQAPPQLTDVFRGYVDYAVRHRDIVARFGRFPHRNAILGRASTTEETEFLKQPGSSF